MASLLTGRRANAGAGGGGKQPPAPSPLSLPTFAAATAPPVPCRDAATHGAQVCTLPHNCADGAGQRERETHLCRQVGRRPGRLMGSNKHGLQGFWSSRTVQAHTQVCARVPGWVAGAGLQPGAEEAAFDFLTRCVSLSSQAASRSQPAHTPASVFTQYSCASDALGATQNTMPKPRHPPTPPPSLPCATAAALGAVCLFLPTRSVLLLCPSRDAASGGGS